MLTIGSGAKVASSITATILWMDDDELFKGKNFFFKLGTKSIPGIVTEIEHTIDVNTGEEKPADKLKKNEIAVVKIAFSDKIVCDKFKNHKTLGEFILIDRVTDMTSACGVVEEVHTEESGLYEGRVDRNVRAAIRAEGNHRRIRRRSGWCKPRLCGGCRESLKYRRTPYLSLRTKGG